MATEKRLIDANALSKSIKEGSGTELQKFFADVCVATAPTVDAVEVPCRCYACLYLLNSKNSLGVYFFCGHQNGLKNLINTEKDFCQYAKKRMDGDSQ